MRRRVGDGDEVAKKRHREGRKLDDPIGAARRRRLAAVRRQDDLDRLSRELSEAHEHLAAASEVLGIISRSPRDAQPVFDAIVQSAARLCGTAFSIVHLYDGESVYLAATNNLPPEALTLVQMLSAKPDRTLLAVRAIVDRAIVHVPDVLKDPDYPRELAVAGGWRAVLAVPMLRNGAPVGAISVGKVEPGPFSDRQVRLLGIFADQAVIAIENTRLFEEVQARRRDLTEALEQQTATSAILRVISTSPTEAQPVFETIVRNAVALCGSLFANVCRFDGELLHFVASHNVGPSNIKLLRAKYPMRPDSSQVAGRVVLTKSVVRLEDTLADPGYDRQFAAAIWRRILGVPMLRQGEPVGVIIVGWAEAGPVPKAQEELLKQFADQAVIAIENARMFEEVETRTRELELRTGELTETLQQQTATAEVLKVISRSAFDLDAVLQALLDSAIRLCAAPRGHIFIYDGEFLRFAVASGAWPGFIEYLRDNPIRPGKGSVSGRAASDRRIVHVHDVLAESGYEHTGLLRQQGFRTVLAVPMLRDEALLGVIALLKSKVEPFTERQIELVATFADQAVIALENARLLDELQQSTREVREALEYQTAISDVLGVISRSPSDVQPVFDTIVRNAVALCGSLFANVFRFDGELLHFVASHNVGPDAVELLRTKYPMRPDSSQVSGRAVLARSVVRLEDALADPDFDQRFPRAMSWRRMLGVPMLRQGEPLGVIVVGWAEAGPVPKAQEELLKQSADQAVIAIENARLFEEVEARTRELTESLEQQTATAKVLEVISRSTFDLEAVLRTLVESAARLCDADKALITRQIGDRFYRAEAYGFSPEFMEMVRTIPLEPERGSASGRALLEGRMVHIADVEADPEYTFVDAIKLGRFRTVLVVPMLREGVPIGVMSLNRSQVRPFSDRQIELVTTFADQAVIAIENARLFEEVQTRTRELTEALEQQTATADVLKAISRATFDLPTVLKTLVEAAARLCEADQGTIAREQAGLFRRVASYGFSKQFNELIRTLPVARERGSATGRALVEGRLVHIPDVQADPEYTFVEAKELGGFRTVLAVPMLREGVAIGVLVLTRREVRPFSDKEIELVVTFADQAAIAIENVRLFESAEARSRELAQSLEDLRTAQDRLVQTEKLASLGQLTAGIAHEIKNPLNFVNNFAAVSTELVDELRAALGCVDLEGKAAEEVTELSQMLSGNLDKIIQHGKRADSIVKNMLLHARQGSGEHRPVDINAIVEESLNLAYHGARAERQGFNITLERSFDPTAGEVDVFPQEITRVLLNLISNGFYAAMKRKAAGDGRDYEPMLKAVTRNLGDSVEITIRDNGTGIPPEVKDQLFRPFFTTKPVGEGTGLGLSISHDIVVKQHAGLIEVDTRPGEFTEFRIILPRAAASLAAGAPA